MLQCVREPSFCLYNKYIIFSLLFVMLVFGTLTVDICVQQWKALFCWRSFWKILSAMTYGLFTVLKKFCGEGGERVDVQKLFGCIGLFTLVALWWLVWPLMALGIEPKFTIPHSANGRSGSCQWIYRKRTIRLLLGTLCCMEYGLHPLWPLWVCHSPFLLLTW